MPPITPFFLTDPFFTNEIRRRARIIFCRALASLTLPISSKGQPQVSLMKGGSSIFDHATVDLPVPEFGCRLRTSNLGFLARRRVTTQQRCRVTLLPSRRLVAFRAL
jgi:hypothetical protein